jgi:hypothetical protein
LSGVLGLLDLRASLEVFDSRFVVIVATLEPIEVHTRLRAKTIHLRAKITHLRAKTKAG